MLDAQYFLEKADQCFRLSQVSSLPPEIVEELKTMGNEFMAKAVALDTARDRLCK